MADVSTIEAGSDAIWNQLFVCVSKRSACFVVAEREVYPPKASTNLSLTSARGAERRAYYIVARSYTPILQSIMRV